MFFVFDTKFYGSNTGYIKEYNQLIKIVPNPVTRWNSNRFFHDKKYK